MPKIKTAAVLAAATMLTLAGCGSASDAAAPAAETADVLTPVSVGVMPIVDVLPVYLGIDQGFFEEAGLEVTPEIAQGGAALTPAVVSGDYQFGYSNTTSLLLGTANGVPLQIVSSGSVASEVGAIVVPEGSDIKSSADLAGATVAVNTLNNIGDSTIRHLVQKDGGDPMKVKFTEMGFPDMPAALDGKQVDAAWIVEPHVTRAVESGGRVIAHNFTETDPELMVAAYFTSKAYAAEHPEVVEAFTGAINRSFEYAEANPDAARAILDKYLELDDAVKKSMVMPRFDTAVNAGSVELLADLALEFGLVEQAVDTAQLLP